MLHVLVLHDANCPSCDEIMDELESMKGEFPELRVRRRLIEEEPEISSRLGVVATPALVVNDQLAFQGHPDAGALSVYFNNVLNGVHNDPDSYAPDDERHPDNMGQEATGSMDGAWRGSGRRPGFGSNPGGRH